MAKDYYAVLGVNRTASEAEIKKAFRTLAHEHHPDKNGGSDTQFKEINEAYQVLGNAEKRKRYDQFGTAFEGAGGSGFAWQDMRGGASPFGNFGGFSQTFDFGDIGDVFGDMFGFATDTATRRSRTARGNDIETLLDVTFDEAYRGTEKDITLQLHLSCEHCSGTGNDPRSAVVTCATCKGSGKITSTHSSFLGAIRTQSVCASCRGTGKRAEKHCPECHGSSVRKRQQTIKVKIPAGIDDGRTIKLSGRGEAGQFGGTRGDLYIRIHVEPHQIFIRHGNNIRSRAEVPLSTLIYGGIALVDTPTGKAKLKIPPRTKSGTDFMLRDKGFEALTGKGRGDQYVSVHAKVPGKLTPSQKKHLSEFETGL